MQRSAAYNAVCLLHNAPSAFRRWSASWKRTQVPLSVSLPRRPLFLPNHIIIYKFISASLAHLHFSLIWQDNTKIGVKIVGVLGRELYSDGAIQVPVAEFCDDSHENLVVYAKVNFLTSLARASLLKITVVYKVSLIMVLYLRFLAVLYDYLFILTSFPFITNAGLLARSQYPEGPATGHLDTGFSWSHCVYKRMLRWFPSFQVATTCFSCSPPDLNFLVTFFFIFVYM